MKAITQQQEQCTYHGEYTAVLWKHDATYGFTQTWSGCPYCIEDRRRTHGYDYSYNIAGDK